MDIFGNSKVNTCFPGFCFVLLELDKIVFIVLGTSWLMVVIKWLLLMKVDYNVFVAFFFSTWARYFCGNTITQQIACQSFV